MDGYSFSFLVRPIVGCCMLCDKATLMVTTVIMILRVWAMYNRSRLILSALITLLSVQIIFTSLIAAVHSDPRNISGTLTLVK